MVLYIVIHRFLKDFIYLFLEKGEEREKERERDFSVREKDCSVASPTGNLVGNPGLCPDQESNKGRFGLQAAPNSVSHASQGIIHSILKKKRAYPSIF